MEPETTASSGRKFLIIALVVILVVAGGAYGYLFMQKDTPLPQAVETVPLPTKTQAQIEQEKQIAQMVQAIPKDTMSQTEQNQLIKTIHKKTTLSDEEKTKILQSIQTTQTQ